jgi:uroporphyrinogen-III synthase
VTLSGKRVVVTRAHSQAEQFGRHLERAGAEVLYLPTIEIRDPDSWDELDSALKRLVAGEYQWMLLASRNAVVRVAARLRGISGNMTAKVAAVGTKTKSALHEAGIDVHLVPETFTGDAMAEGLGEGTGKILFPRVGGGPRDIIQSLEARGWSVDEVTAYINAAPRAQGANHKQVRAGEFDVVTFLSPSSVTNFVKLVGTPDELGLAEGSPSNKVVGCIGPKTSQRLRELNFRIDVSPDEHTSASLVEALVTSLI